MYIVTMTLNKALMIQNVHLTEAYANEDVKMLSERYDGTIKMSQAVGQARTSDGLIMLDGEDEYRVFYRKHSICI